jgi:hypothetical protein
MSDRQQDFWHLVRILLDSIQAGESRHDARLRLREIIHDFRVNSEDAAKAITLVDASIISHEKEKRKTN